MLGAGNWTFGRDSTEWGERLLAAPRELTGTKCARLSRPVGSGRGGHRDQWRAKGDEFDGWTRGLAECVGRKGDEPF
jgi:hypothetical protein